MQQQSLYAFEIEEVTSRPTMPAPASYELDFCSPSTERRTEPAPAMSDEEHYAAQLAEARGVSQDAYPMARNNTEGHGIKGVRNMGNDVPRENVVVPRAPYADKPMPKRKPSPRRDQQTPPDMRMTVEDQGQIPANHPYMTVDAQVFYRVLGRVDGGPWSWEHVGLALEACTFTCKSHADGALKFLKLQAQRIQSPQLEYCTIPLLTIPKAL